MGAQSLRFTKPAGELFPFSRSFVALVTDILDNQSDSFDAALMRGDCALEREDLERVLRWKHAFNMGEASDDLPDDLILKTDHVWAAAYYLWRALDY